MPSRGPDCIAPLQVPAASRAGPAPLAHADAQRALGRAGARAGRPGAADAAGAARACASAASTRRCELARRLAPGKADATLLLRMRETAPQSGLDRERERLRNVQRRLRASSRCAPPSVRGRRVVLVDDVMTSGASLHRGGAGAARRPARRTSARVVLARTDAPDCAGAADNRRHVPHRPRRTRDPAQHRQRDPPGSQHRLHAAPGRAAGLLDGRPAAAPRRPGLPRVRRSAAPRGLASAASTTQQPDAPTACSRSPRAARAPCTTCASQPGDWLVFGSETRGLAPELREQLRAGAAAAAADARRPAQPQPVERGGGDGVRGLAAERLRGAA